LANPVGADVECDEEGRWPNVEKLPVEADVPEYLIKQALTKGSTEEEQAVVDLTLIAFYLFAPRGRIYPQGNSQQLQTETTVQAQGCDILQAW
jgi:hypothetical protein